jgi:uncharacterized iron-regulated membrane protein
MTGAERKTQTLVQRALGGHAAIGLLACALIYIISLTGSLIVIHDTWQRWEQPNVVEMTALPASAAQAAMTSVLALEKDGPKTTHLYIRLPTEELPRAVVTTDSRAWYVDGSGRPVAREGNAWIEFVIGLHEYLHLPSTLGLILVGALGVALAALVITGVLAHPRIVRDAFRLRARQHPQIARVDWHNRLGAWTLPFVLAVALTGAFIGLGNVGFTMLARAYSGGDILQAYSAVYGSEPKPDARTAPLPNIAAALETVAARVPQATPTYVIVHDPGTRGQHVQIIATHPQRLIYGETYRFDGRGGWVGPIGMADGALGQQAAASAYNLHFGNFGGLTIEVAYMLFGLALCVVTSTGTTLWLDKRHRRGRESGRLRAGWAVIVWGTPLLIVIAYWVRVIAPEAPLAILFWSALGAALLSAIVRPHPRAGHHLRRAFMLGLILTAGGHLIVGRPSAPASVAIDLVMLIGAFAVLYATRTKDSRCSGKMEQSLFARATTELL